MLDRLERMPLPPGKRLAAQVTLEAAQVLKPQVEALTAEIARQVAEVPEVRLLLTITGVGLRSSGHHLGQAGRS